MTGTDRFFRVILLNTDNEWTNLKLTVLVLLGSLRRDGFDGIPMLGNLAILHAE